MKISQIKKTFSVRKINNAYVDFLVGEFKANGYQEAYPVSITVDNILWDGSHRLAAVKRLGWTEIPHIIETPDNIRKASHDRNRAASNSLPETFIDHAVEIWELIGHGMTQQAVADEVGWSVDKIKKYCALENISPIAWDMIVTVFQNIGTFIQEDDGTNKVPPVTENLLRTLLNLTEHHQIAIIQEVIAGKIKVKQVKGLAKIYFDREGFAEYAVESLACKEDAAGFFADCFSGLYNTQDQIEKAVKRANEEYQKKNMISMMHGDCLEVLDKIEDNSCDALITDPPYSMINEAWDKFDSVESFIVFTKQWLSKALPKIKPSGRIYIFWPPTLHAQFPYDAIPQCFTPGTSPMPWIRKNAIKPHNRKDYVLAHELIFYFYGVDAPDLNLPKSENWDKTTNNMGIFEYAQPQTNFADKKEHPAQKPIDLMKEIINVGTEIGDTILDCFAGTGTTGVAAKILKRKAILIEQDMGAVKIIKKRLA